ncbi:MULTISPECIES: c-type cytochrome [Rhizobium]|uniref:c-type cytochrome n=1 Tax=Rhizobium TaxID=379 RepID=UPI0007E59959|nr:MULTISPECIES: cytochrome c [Rhizobium]MBY5579204.1 cytochrome c [Rhizobium leguminosarum]
MAKFYSTALLLVATLGHADYRACSPPIVVGAGATTHESSCPIAEAELLYELNCSTCHGTHGEGVKAAIPPLAGDRALNLDVETLTRKLKEGSAGRESGIGMPSFQGKLSDQLITCLVEYLGSGMKGSL